MSRQYRSTAVLLVITLGVAFSAGYWMGTVGFSKSQESSPFALEDLEARLRSLEMRLNEQLIIIPVYVGNQQTSQFAVMNIGNSTVTLTDVRINNYTNSSSSGWMIYGANMIQVGECSSVLINLSKYPKEAFSKNPTFSFITSKGNTYYCIPTPLIPPETSYTAFEQLELPTAYATYNTNFFSSKGGWNITIELKNTGSADATISGIFLNAKPLKDYTSGTTNLYSYVPPGGSETTQTLSAISVVVTKGSSATLVLQVQKYDEGTQSGVQGCTSGTRIDLKIHTASGRDYPVQVKLP